MTNEEVSALLNLPMDDVAELGEELGVPTDGWTAEDVFEADAMLDEEDEGEDDEDEDEDEGG
ncbi:MAG: hypothetical protein ACLP1X_30445 [Polyangiaceae bacterium]|jgi:hypothetical protein